MGTNEVFIGEFQARLRNLAINHSFLAAEVELVVRRTVRTVRDDQRWLTAAASATTALGVVRGRWRHIAHVHCIQVTDIDAELHCRRAVQDWERAGPKLVLASNTDFVRDLR